MADFFGFIRNAFSLKVKEKKAVSVVPQMSNDGAVTIDAGISSGGLITSFLPLLESGIYGTEAELISRYRMMSMDADCDRAISEVVNDAIVHNDNECPTSINLDKTNFSDDVKKILTDEFEYICGLVNYNRDAHLLFRTNYIDGKSYFHIVVNQDQVSEGIQEIRFIDPRQIAKIREVSKDVSSTGVSVYKTEREYFVFNPVGLLNSPSSTNTMTTSGTILDVNSIIYVHSGKLDVRAQKIISHLDKAYRPWTKLREMEDSVVIYRLSRAPERRVFYIDIGEMQNIHVESHMREMMNKFKNKVSYDSSDGGINSQRRIQAMTEDYWIPRKGGSTATEIDTLPAGQNLGEIEDVNYFKKKFYNSLNVPTMRLDPENGFSIGRSSEITREELKFSRFINQLRNSFATQFFNQPLRIQAILKNIVSEEDWEENESKIVYEWATDSHFSELKEAELWRERLSLAKEAGVENPITEGYISKEFVKKNFFKLTEEDIDEISGNQNTEQLGRDDSPKELGFDGDQETVKSSPESDDEDEDFQDDEDDSEDSKEKEVSVSDRDFEFLDVIDEDLDDDKQ